GGRGGGAGGRAGGGARRGRRGGAVTPTRERGGGGPGAAGGGPGGGAARTPPAVTAILGGDLDELIERLRGLQNDECGHELGDRGDGNGDVGAARVEHRGVRGIEHKRGARAQRRNRR